MSKPWENEPSHVDFKHVGYPCILHRNPLGAWCGYVGVPKGHPAYGRNYDEVDVEAHGGITYANGCQGVICHKVAEGEDDDVWWLGFDCAHFGDLAPAMLKYHETIPGYPAPFDGDVYRDMNYVRGETESLAEQLKALEEPLDIA